MFSCLHHMFKSVYNFMVSLSFSKTAFGTFHIACSFPYPDFFLSIWTAEKCLCRILYNYMMNALRITWPLLNSQMVSITLYGPQTLLLFYRPWFHLVLVWPNELESDCKLSVWVELFMKWARLTQHWSTYLQNELFPSSLSCLVGNSWCFLCRDNWGVAAETIWKVCWKLLSCSYFPV